MPFVNDTRVTTDNIPFPWCTDRVMTGLIKRALAEGRRVQIQSSLFSDPGEDWNELLVDGQPIPGSRIYGH